jgi:acetyl-CoA carboxylase carboxyltransferase component
MTAEVNIEVKIDELRSALLKAKAGGGKARVQRQHDLGKLTARERITKLCDRGSFVEIGALVQHRCSDLGMEKRELPADGVVTGYCTIQRKGVFVYSQDFTVMGGSVGEKHAEKICRILELAIQTRVPVIGLNDSAGARIQEGVDSLSGYGRIFYQNVKASGVIPQITAIMGPCAGGAVYSPALTDFTIMVDKTSHMFVTGPAVAKAATGQVVSMEDLGGTDVHSRVSGVTDLIVKDDNECIQTIKKILSYLPSNNKETPPKIDVIPPSRVKKIEDIIPTNPRKGYDIRKVIECVVDGSELFELKPRFASNLIIGFARIEGNVIGIIANQPRFLAGCLDVNSSDKGARFIRFCDAFNIPLITFVDVSGFLPGINQEQGGIIRHGAKMLYAYSEATVPKVTIIVRKAYGGAYLAMCSKDLGADLVFALPTAEIAVMGPEGAVDFIYGHELRESKDPDRLRKEKTLEYRKMIANPYRAAARGYIDAVIEPHQIRQQLVDAMRILSEKCIETSLKLKKHGNIPL